MHVFLITQDVERMGSAVTAYANVWFIRRDGPVHFSWASEHSVYLNEGNQEKLKYLIYTTLNCGAF